MVSFIESRLATMRQADGGSELSTRSSGWELQPEVGQWLVRWEDITLVRVIGRGSYGRVYAARWNETPVACKVLVNAGARACQQGVRGPGAGGCKQLCVPPAGLQLFGQGEIYGRNTCLHSSAAPGADEFNPELVLPEATMKELQQVCPARSPAVVCVAAQPGAACGRCASPSLPFPPALGSLQEAVAMAMMRHPNIIQFMGLCALPACILTGKAGGWCTGTGSHSAADAKHDASLVASTCYNAAHPGPAITTAELCSRGSLYDVLRGASRDPAKAAELTWQLRLRMALDAATGLLYLHCRTPQILHRDVKSPNLVSCHSFRLRSPWNWACHKAEHGLHALSSGHAGWSLRQPDRYATLGLC